MIIRNLSVAILLLVLAFAIPLSRSENHRSDSPGNSEFQTTLADLQATTELETTSIADDEQIRKLGMFAYYWGWPMVYVHNCRKALEMVPFRAHCGGAPVAPINQLCMLSDHVTANVTSIVCPNQDVVYGFGMFDLKQEPVVLQVPDFGDRFWLYQLGDQRTESFGKIGKMHGTAPGNYLVVGPDWHGATPPNFQSVLRCSTRFAFCIPRVFLANTSEDRRAVQNVTSSIVAYPLSSFDGSPKRFQWENARWLPTIARFGKHGNSWVKPERFFDALAQVLDDVPPLSNERRLYENLKSLLARAETDTRIKSVLVEAACHAEQTLVQPRFHFRKLGTHLPHFWTTISNGAAFGDDYQTRTAVAKSNIFVNRHEETKYFYQDCDHQGRPLTGSNSYLVRFAPGELPPAKGFWSVTLYDQNHLLYKNDHQRHSFGTKDKTLRFEPDGSLVIYVQPEAPANKTANWLPAPRETFSLYLRAYWPDEKLLDGSWTPPPVERHVEVITVAEGADQRVDLSR